MRNFILGLAFVSVVFSACYKTNYGTLNAIDDVSSFTNLKLNNTWIYKIDSISFHQINNTISRSTFYFKDSLVDTFMDNQNNFGYRVLRMIKDTTVNGLWTVYKNYYVTPTATEYLVTIDNHKTINLLSPAYKNRKWSGSKYLNIPHDIDFSTAEESWEYTYTDIEPYNNGYINSDTSIYVEQIDFWDGDSMGRGKGMKINFKEIYSKNIGLPYRKELYWKIDANKLKEGYILTYTLVEYR